MAILTKEKSASSHWYTADAKPMHMVPTADGSGKRETRVNDARRLGLFPSVTSILNILAKPGLDTWKLNQVALATLRAPRQEAESDQYWCNRVRNAAFEQVEEAADLGTKIHFALEAAMSGTPYDDNLRVYVEPVLAWKAKTGIVIAEREKCLVNRVHGFAGTSDVLFRFGMSGLGVLDYKTKKTEPGKPVEAYNTQKMQLAAYAATRWGEEHIGQVLGANVFISTTEPGRVEVVKVVETLAPHWEAFKHACELWRYINKYDPRVAMAGRAA